jgi:UDP-glucose:(heptosyl)LPS alpha-1,3-glucosyltransferase
VYEAARYYRCRHDVTVYAQEFEPDGLDGVAKEIIPSRRVPSSLRLHAFSRDVKRRLASRHDHVVSFGVCDVDTDVAWVNSVHAAWLERRDLVAGNRLRSSPLRRYLPRHQTILQLERGYFTPPTTKLAITVSDRVADDIERIYGFPRDRCVVVQNGFDPAEFTPELARACRADTRRELGLPADAVVLLLVANELSRKGFSVLLNAVARLDDPTVYLLLVGRADPTAYRQQIERLELTARFRYAASRSDMARIHGASDLLVLPTRYEAFCLAVVEALASGLPVITTDVPGARDLIVDGVNGGLQRDPLDDSELAELLRDAIGERRFIDWAANSAASVRGNTWPALFDRAASAIAGEPTGDASRRPADGL